MRLKHYLSTLLGRLLRIRPQVGIESLALAASLFFALASNSQFLKAALDGRVESDPSTWIFGSAMLVMLTTLHLFLLLLVLHRSFARVLLSALLIATAFASYYMQRFGVFMDPSMLRNVLRTDVAEARELFSFGMVPHLTVFAGLPLLLLWRVQIANRSLMRSLALRGLALMATGVLLIGSVFVVYQDFSALMRNQKEMRYLVTPANFLYSTARVLTADTRQATAARLTVGADARQSASWSARPRPTLLVLAIGETARAANWGLNGYVRQTTPELAKQDVLNFTDVTACGTNTETSLPCMFSAVGRRNYDEERIRGSESLLHVLNRAGFQVLWRDNQSGCKGVCDGLPTQQIDPAQLPELCVEGRCLDDALLSGLDTVARDAKGNLVVVLHMLGNHGPTYYKRYPDAFRRFLPTCDTGELRKCTKEEIVNAYDNALLYTDHILSKTINFLKQQEQTFDTALMYVSDHGESLGESGLYLHGVPYAIAPDVQIKVPMVWWLSAGFTKSFGLDQNCLKKQTTKPWAHDELFHTVLGLLQVQTSVYERKFDISAGCRPE
ncbi:MAG: phosphoethanolamine--lipid A transferase [Hydrogenophaga sp.]|jgi:lipid A ethanolaminephosphotransferase|uniref:phosphoethanolamine transferase n=1 Tax=Hydrogenophaga sp. TaxID=1904254 RepID=UPI001D741232|nr:phosphoethanolamine--lipid A transferase [Hydrogenophaga sp.]MBW0170241.1 phosphoethanolamine--lipid A transferase [Hydrogenophaga sp.]MBW0182399.1 phosphoethanolamine--lipid A transferase [Hydrogenophaga sp.]